jgi:hypothetical protein
MVPTSIMLLAATPQPSAKAMTTATIFYKLGHGDSPVTQHGPASIPVYSHGCTRRSNELTPNPPKSITGHELPPEVNHYYFLKD